MPAQNPIVFSTEWGEVCPKCQKPVAQCSCKKNAGRARGDGIVRVQRESKGRKGKTVTLISGVPLEDDALKTLMGDLKRSCGAGGSIKDGVIEIQGDHRDAIVAELKKRGFPVKLAGG
jgi:translation initiation factor 1